MLRLGIVGVMIVCGVLLFTNPGHDAHKKTVYASIAAEATTSKAIGKLATELLGEVDVIPLQYHNYYLFSTTSLDGKTKSIGFLARVWNWN